MKILAIANSGGKGKTWITKNLALSLSNQHNKRVLIVDLDFLVGSNISSHFLADSQIRSSAETILEVLGDSRVLPHYVSPTISIFVGNDSLRHADQQLSLQENSDAVLKMFLQSWDLSNDYEYCIIDCTGEWNGLTRNAIVAANRVLVPQWAHRGLGTAEMNVSLTFQAVDRLRTEHSLPKEICLSVTKPLDEFKEKDWGSLTSRCIALLDADSYV